MDQALYQKAQALHRVIGEIELGLPLSHADFVCITGTNGQNHLHGAHGEMFRIGGRRTFVLGNIGVPITRRRKQRRAT